MGRYSNLSKRGLYRSRNGILLGVCRGVAEYFDFSVFWIRALVVILFIFTGFWPVVGLYILAALLMKSEPAHRTRAGLYY
jgi:phage shock protein C